MKIGDKVFYWTKQKGKHARKIYGTILEFSKMGTEARVDGYDSCVPVQIISTKRLRHV